MSGHTATPWTVVERGFRTQIIHPGACRHIERIADMIDSDLESGDEAKENARRIVAAVNATKDFTIEALEQIAENGGSLKLALLASTNLEGAAK